MGLVSRCSSKSRYRDAKVGYVGFLGFPTIATCGYDIGCQVSRGKQRSAAHSAVRINSLLPAWILSKRMCGFHSLSCKSLFDFQVEPIWNGIVVHEIMFSISSVVDTGWKAFVVPNHRGKLRRLLLKYQSHFDLNGITAISFIPR